MSETFERDKTILKTSSSHAPLKQYSLKLEYLGEIGEKIETFAESNLTLCPIKFLNFLTPVNLINACMARFKAVEI
jgi:hypothetical protein